jgi:hypothetical protein
LKETDEFVAIKKFKEKDGNYPDSEEKCPFILKNNKNGTCISRQRGCAWYNIP